MPHSPYCGHDGLVTWTALVERNSQTTRVHSDSCSDIVLHHSSTVRFESFRMTTVSTHNTTVPLALCFRRLQHWLTHCSHSRDSCYPMRVHCTALCRVVLLDISRSLLFTFLCLHTSHHVAASPFSVFVFVIFQFSDGRAAECAAASRHHMVESLLLHGYSALSTTMSPAFTSWCVLLDVCAATGLYTGVQRHNVFRLRVQPTVTT